MKNNSILMMLLLASTSILYSNEHETRLLNYFKTLVKSFCSSQDDSYAQLLHSEQLPHAFLRVRLRSGLPIAHSKSVYCWELPCIHYKQCTTGGAVKYGNVDGFNQSIELFKALIEKKHSVLLESVCFVESVITKYPVFFSALEKLNMIFVDSESRYCDWDAQENNYYQLDEITGKKRSSFDRLCVLQLTQKAFWERNCENLAMQVLAYNGFNDNVRRVTMSAASKIERNTTITAEVFRDIFKTIEKYNAQFLLADDEL